MFSSAKDVMTKVNHVSAVDNSDSLHSVATVLLENDIGCVLVQDGEKFLGIITKTDITKAYQEQLDPFQTRVKSIVKKYVFSCEEQDSLEKVASLMHNKRIHHLLVKKKSVTVGVISAIDLIKPLFSQIK
jgi:predicted transcriptional regulator